MQLEINRKSGIPLYLQLKEQIKKQIRTGFWEAGGKIPTERDLAKKLLISRNTVSTAYKELEGEGILTSSPGRGTFVTDSDAIIKRESRLELLFRIIDMTMEEAAELGFTIDQYVALTIERAKNKKEFLRKVKVAFIECNREQLDFLTKEIRIDSGVAITPILLDDFKNNPLKVNKDLVNIDIIVSTYFHLQEVKELIEDKNKKVLGIALDPQLETIVRIAKIPKGNKLGIVCLSDSFIAKVKSSLKKAGITHLECYSTTSKNIDSLAKDMKNLDAIVVSPNRKNEIERIFPDKEIIEFRYLPDVGSLNILKTTLLELKQK